MFTLSDKTKQAIEKSTGLTMNEIITLDIKTLEDKIETKIGKKLSYMSHDYKRILSMDKIDKGLSKI